MKTDCRFFSGYKPCQLSPNCDSCLRYSPIEKNILFVHLGAIGAVLRSTAILKKIKSQFPNSHLTWVTDRPSHQLLEGHPLIDKVVASDFESLLSLKGKVFEVCYVVDKSLKAIGIAEFLNCREVFGFHRSPHSEAVLPATEAARELWSLGLDNHRKFFINQKSETQLVMEALELVAPSAKRECVPEYDLPLNSQEKESRKVRKQKWTQNSSQGVIGINTGCSDVIPAKKLTVSFHRELILKLMELGYQNIVLLGGPEDGERNQKIGEGLNVIQSPTHRGLRDGLISVAACDIVITGDSLGMHMAISQKCFTIAWFGPTCEQEIEFYGRGISILSAAECRPCWKRSCDKATMCYDQVEIGQFISAVQVGMKQWQSINENPAMSETSFSSSKQLS